VSCYELGHQPQGIASPLAFLERAGFQPATLDLAVEPLDAERVRTARFVAISTPMHTALRIGIEAARRVRAIQPAAHVCFHGHYAILHANRLNGVADSILGGESEDALVEIIAALDRGERSEARPSRPAARVLRKLDFPVPRRDALPPLSRYAQLEEPDASGGPVRRLAGHVEASRGCRHLCRHCPIPAVYAGRFFVVPVDVVLQDIRYQVRAGATHITFGDPDFLNGPGHAMRIVRAMHAEFPELTFDFTAKIEHLQRERLLLPELVASGARFVVSAAESLNDRVLAILDKGHTRADLLEVVRRLRDVGLALRPSWLPFTPWSTLEDYVELLDFVEAEDLIANVDAVQYTIRLLVPEGSLLLNRPEMQAHVRAYEPARLSHAWVHPDPCMDALHESVSRLVAEAARSSDAIEETFTRVRELAESAAGKPRATAEHVSTRRRARPPRLTETWFCCAEPLDVGFGSGLDQNAGA
jgi:radical SAM superfamily enzyme YgiQ (UPF0313 family)